MIVDISQVGEDGKEFTGEEPPEILDLRDADDVKPVGPVRYRIRVSPAGDSVVARGVIKADLSFLCVRCAEFFRFTVCEPEFMVVREILDKDESVDLTQDIRESMILAFPTNPLCAQDCKGLCSLCGANLNKRKCRCENSSAGWRWGALDNLKLR